MGHKNKKSLIRQVEEALTAKLAPGRSKQEDKKTDEYRKWIYSYDTLKSYLKQDCYFVKYCKEKHKCKTLEDCRAYVDEYLTYSEERGLSKWTIKLYASAIAKLYGCSPKDFRDTPPRRRRDIKRSRNECVRDKHFSAKNNADVIMMGRCTGLRRKELSVLTGDCLKYIKGQPCVYVRNGKGGRIRYAPIIDHVEEITAYMRLRGGQKLFDKVPGNMDEHGYRSEYAVMVYKKYARPLETLTKKQKYYCRGDMKGIVYDRQAMMIASNALGHNRINVIAGHYLRGVYSDDRQN